ncbi:BUD7 [[Candida] subhashii]|uniref:BUD7 n=1 Tax=[Candida] subhashii TaxID=561895 RepID=A0A8J5QSL8_9ASCO|nr:BUD7 [[Candida] subhashii]KAG7665861.1 BUD7 [[Candida] subhashii]
MLPPSIASIPEVKEEYPGASLIERTARLIQITDLGPADLCNIHKSSVTSSKKEHEIGTFLYFTGVDTSNTASIAAHLQSLANLMTAKSQYWFGEKKHWKVPELTYCSYNAFSRVDMRVTVHIPGRLDVSVVNYDGKLIHDKLESEEEWDRLWQETFVSSIVRSVLENDNDEDVNKAGGIVEVRKINPFNNGIVSKELLNSFLNGFEQLFFQGPKLGCGVEIPQPTLICNYLVDGFMKVIQLTQTYDRALEILRNLQKEEPSVISLIAQVLLLKQDEVGAVKVMNQGILDNKRDSNLLILQTEYCLEKKKPELALELAKQAVKSSPSDFKTWAILVKVYTRLGDFENALLTLNSCPMNSHKEKYQLRRIVSLKSNNDLHLPSPVDVTLDEVSNLQSNEISEEQKSLDPQLLNLPAANLKSTFAKAYDLLTEIVVKTGWESLLKYRAKVFVMEEEYRKDRNASNGSFMRKNSSVSNVTDTLKPQDSVDTANNNLNTNGEDASSTMAIKSPHRGAFTDNETETEAEPSAIATATETEAADDDFKKKRLCERWLDNLFMLLYEDLRVYTVWQAESLHFQAQQMDYKKTTLEWEILGSIAYRLKHFKEGSVAFANALSGRFSAKSQREMLRYYVMEKNKLLTKNTSSTSSNGGAIHNYTKTMNQLNEKILESIIKLLVWNHRWYSDFSPYLLLSLSDLIAWEGSIKIQSSVRALHSENPLLPAKHANSSQEHFGNHGIIDMMNDLDFDYIKLYKLSNADE